MDEIVKVDSLYELKRIIYRLTEPTLIRINMVEFKDADAGLINFTVNLIRVIDEYNGRCFWNLPELIATMGKVIGGNKKYFLINRNKRRMKTGSYIVVLHRLRKYGVRTPWGFES